MNLSRAGNTKELNLILWLQKLPQNIEYGKITFSVSLYYFIYAKCHERLPVLIK